MYFGFQNISIRYGKKDVLRDVTLDIPQGSIVTIIGQNGCGKSSLLKTVPRAVSPRGGSVIYRDAPVFRLPPKERAQKIAYLPQVHVSPPDIDAWTLVSYGRFPHGKFGRGLLKTDREIIEQALAMTGLTDLAKRKVQTLSGGERQRAWIAMTIAQEPEILILDEPTTYLDVSYQVEVLELVKRLNREMGITIVMVLHDLNLAARYSSLLYCIRDGSVYASGAPEQILTEQTLREVFSIEARVLTDQDHDCPYFIPLKTLMSAELAS